MKGQKTCSCWTNKKKILNDNITVKEKSKRDRDRYKRLKDEKNTKLVNDMTEKEKKNPSKLWRNRQAALKQRKKAGTELIAIPLPPVTMIG